MLENLTKQRSKKMKFMSVSEVAAVLEVNETTVRRNAKMNKYPFRVLRIGGLWKFPADEVRAFAEVPNN